MILPLADSLMNCLQNLTSRIAGVDNEQMTNRVIGMGAMMGFGLGAIKEQFKTPTQNNSNNRNNNSSSGLNGFISRAKSIINPTMNLSSETDYNGNINPIRNVEKTSIPKTNEENKQNVNNGIKTAPKNIATGILKTGYNATKTYLKTGASLAEGKFNNNTYKSNSFKKGIFQNTEYINKVANDKANIKNLGDENES